MKLSILHAISPIDGRYSKRVSDLSAYFSEFALIRYRVMVEIYYFIALHELSLKELKNLNVNNISKLREIYINFTLKDAKSIKKIEKKTNHDVKAVEYFLKKKFIQKGLKEYMEFVHFGLTSQDINNTAVPLMLKEASENVFFPLIKEVKKKITELAVKWKDIPMLAFTHGQPATPTILGKELRVFSYRIDQQLNILKNIPFSAKFGGTVGNFNAHYAAYPNIRWIEFANNFIEKKLQLQRSKYTTQIENYDHLSARFNTHQRINTILIDLCRDIWQYMSLGYLKQKSKKGEIGSSVMPYKVNPIDFEHAEGNLGIANALYTHFSTKLPVSRLQRDLTDSTVLRNIGVSFGHEMIALKSIMSGLSKLQIDERKMNEDLKNNWVVVAEAIQTILRKEKFPKPYENLKKMINRIEHVDQKHIFEFIEKLDIDSKIKTKLHKITPHNYTGVYE